MKNEVSIGVVAGSIAVVAAIIVLAVVGRLNLAAKKMGLKDASQGKSSPKEVHV